VPTSASPRRGSGTPVDFQVLDGWVYYTDRRVVGRVSTDGGDAETLTTDCSNCVGLATDGETVYYSSNDAGTILAVPANGGGTWNVAAPGLKTLSVVLLDDVVYFTAESGGSGAVYAVSAGGGALTSIATGTYPFQLETNGAWLYWTDSSRDVRRTPVGGGSTEILASGEPNVARLAPVDGAVFWTNYASPGSVRGVDAGGALLDLAAWDVPILGVAADGGWVYYSVPSLGEVWRVPADGGVSEWVTTAPGEVADLAIDGGVLYLLGTSGGGHGYVAKVALPL
jgi:hypothetical protein